MAENLAGKKIAILVDNGFEQAELLKPREALDHAGATTVVVSPQSGKVKGWDTKDWGEEVEVDMALSEADAVDFDALQLPGGVMNPDHLRMNPEAVKFVQTFFDAGKPVAAICHAPWSLIEATWCAAADYVMAFAEDGLEECRGGMGGRGSGAGWESGDQPEAG